MSLIKVSDANQAGILYYLLKITAQFLHKKSYKKLLMNYYDSCVRHFQQDVSSHRSTKRDWLCIKICSAIWNDKEASEDCWTCTTHLSVSRRRRWHTVPWAISNAPFGTEFSSLHAQVMWMTETTRMQKCYPILILKPQFELCSIQINRLLRYFNNAASTENVIRLRYYYVRPCWSAVGIATGYGLDDRGVGVRVPIGLRMFTSPRRSDRLWGLPSLSNGATSDYFPEGKAARAWSWLLTSK
jgi:hypothetical protein